MQSRSIRRSGQPTRARASRMRPIDWDLIRGGHYGQRSCEPHAKAEHMAAPTNAALVKKVLANSEPSTHGPSPHLGRRSDMSGCGDKTNNGRTSPLTRLTRPIPPSRSASSRLRWLRNIELSPISGLRARGQRRDKKGLQRSGKAARSILTAHKPIRPHPHQCRTVLRTGLEGEAPGTSSPQIPSSGASIQWQSKASPWPARYYLTLGPIVLAAKFLCD